ncbi:UNVERIFIED_CONTAM: hypothetical protein FKN15_024809 [Acipenser sinensis]
MGFEGPGPPLLKKARGSQHQPRPPPPIEIAHPMDIRGLFGGGLGFKGGGVWPIAASVLCTWRELCGRAGLCP